MRKRTFRGPAIVPCVRRTRVRRASIFGRQPSIRSGSRRARARSERQHNGPSIHGRTRAIDHVTPSVEESAIASSP